MEALKGLTERKWVVAGVALLLGIILGIIYGWVINPVEWTDALPEHLRSDLRQEYLRMAIVSYSVNQDAELARERICRQIAPTQDCCYVFGKRKEWQHNETGTRITGMALADVRAGQRR